MGRQNGLGIWIIWIWGNKLIFNSTREWLVGKVSVEGNWNVIWWYDHPFAHIHTVLVMACCFWWIYSGFDGRFPQDVRSVATNGSMLFSWKSSPALFWLPISIRLAVVVRERRINKDSIKLPTFIIELPIYILLSIALCKPEFTETLTLLCIIHNYRTLSYLKPCNLSREMTDCKYYSILI